jgi:hypothetical protein
MAQVSTSDRRVIGLTKESTINEVVLPTVPDYQIEQGQLDKVATEDINGNELNRMILEQLHLIRAHLEVISGEPLTITDIDNVY